MSTVTPPHPPPFFPSIDCWLPLTPHHNPLVLKTDKPSCNSKKASLKENTESAGKAWPLGPTSAPDETTPSPCPTAPWWNQPSQQIFFNPDAKVWRNRGGGSFLFLLSFSKEFGLRNMKTESAEVLLLIMLICIMSPFRRKRFRRSWLSSTELLKATLETLALLKWWVFFFFFMLSRVIQCVCPQSYGNGKSKHSWWLYSWLPRGQKWQLHLSNRPCICRDGSSSKGSQLVKILRAKTTQVESNFS